MANQSKPRTHESCCICNTRIPSNAKKVRVGQPKLLPLFRRYIGVLTGNVDVDQLLCKKCEIRIKNLKLHPPKRIPTTKMQPPVNSENSGGSLADIGSESEPMDSHCTTEPDDDAIAMEDNIVISSFPSTNNASQNSFESETSQPSMSSSASSQQSSVSSSKSQDQRTGTIRLPGIRSCASTQRHCFVCKSKEGRTRVPKSAVMSAWLTRRIRIPDGNRCCNSHLDNGRLTEDSLNAVVTTKDYFEASVEDLTKWVTDISDEASRKLLPLDFTKTSTMTDEDFDMLLGLNRCNFEKVLEHCKGMRDSKNRSVRSALALFLMKLRLNLSQRVLGFLFGIINLSTVSETITAVLDVLVETFVPEHIGYSHLTREELMAKHMRPFFTTMLEKDPEDLILVLDGTYLYIEKSSDIQLQQQTYSSHKHRNLFKPMMIVCPSGYILEAEGLYYANSGNNDAKILNSMLSKADSILTVLQTRDALILDRGFRDSIDSVKECKLDAFMPLLLKKNQKQFSALEANQSRQITMLRWIVESANGRLKKKFKFFDGVIPEPYFPKLNSFLRVAVALINAFSPPLFTETEDHTKLAEIALSRLPKNNLLQSKVEEEKLDSRNASWQEVQSGNLLDFPKFSLEELKWITLGPYQIQMGLNYNKHHTKSASGYDYSK